VYPEEKKNQRNITIFGIEYKICCW